MDFKLSRCGTLLLRIGDAPAASRAARGAQSASTAGIIELGADEEDDRRDVEIRHEHDEHEQIPRSVLVVDVVDLLLAEEARLALDRTGLRALAPTALVPCSTVCVSSEPFDPS
jgi:hypothetical protein